MTRLLLAISLTASLLVVPQAVPRALAQQPPVEGQEPDGEEPNVDDVAPRAEPPRPPVAPPRAPTPPPGPSSPGSRRMPPIPPPGPGRQITMDFNDADLQVLVKFMSELTGKNFILDERVRGKVTIISPSRITVDEAYKVFESVLDVKGFTTVPVGAALKIIPARDAKQTGIPVAGPDRPLDSRAAGYITRLIPLKNITAQDLVPILTPLVSKDGSLLASQTTNTLIVTDSQDNLARLVAIVDQLDVAGFQDRYEVISLRYATARDLAATLQQLVQPRAPAGRAPRPGGPAAVQAGAAIEGARIIPDERTNSLVVQATASDVEAIRNLIAQLDREVPRSAGRINVIYLRHADAEEVAKVLAQLSPAQSAPAGRAGGAPPRTAMLATPTPGPVAAATGGPLPGGPVGAPPTTAAAAAGPGPAAELEGGVKVTADKATNSLIVTASPADFEAIRSVVSQLDVRRAQVFVEALIMEVSLSRTREIGVQGTGVGRIGSASVIGGTGTGANPFAIADNVINPIAPIASTLGGGAFGRSITITNPLTGQPVTFPSFTALVRFLNTVADVNVLSAPHLLTTNNKEAEIVVAQNIPFITGQTSTITTPEAVQTQIDRRDVGITLRLTPQINEGDLVRLDIFQEISAVTEPPEGLNVNQVGVTTTKRSAKTSVLVQDEATIVIGGLIRDDLNQTENKIPILGDIPILGYLFKNSTRRLDKTNLLIFLTPHIVRSPEEIAEITKRRQEQFEQWKARYNVGELDESGWIFDPVERARRGGIRDGYAVNEPIPDLSVRAVRPRPAPAPAAPTSPEAPAEPPAGTDGS